MRAPSRVLLVCLLAGTPSAAAEADTTEEEAIQEAVLRDYLKSVANSKQIFFVTVNRQDDPSEALLTHLADLKLDLRKGSRATTDRASPNPASQNVFDRRTNEPGTLLTMGRIHQGRPLRANVELKRYQGGLNASIYECTVKKKDGRWQVVTRKLVGQS